jgi:GTPase
VQITGGAFGVGSVVVTCHVRYLGLTKMNELVGKNVHKVLKACVSAGEQHMKRVSTGTLNLVVSDATQWKAPPSLRGVNKRPRVYYATQASVRPPTFIFFCNDGRLIGDDYKRYLERSLRESIDLEGTPIRIFFRGRTGAGPTAK